MAEGPRRAPLFASVAAAAYHNSTFGMKNLFALFAGAMPFLAQTPAPLAPDLPQHTRSIMDVIIGAGVWARNVTAPANSEKRLFIPKVLL